MGYKSSFCTIIALLLISYAISYGSSAEYKHEELLKKFEWKGNQTSLSGTVDSLIIKKDDSEFKLASGNIVILDFDAGRPAIMMFDGDGTFKYSPQQKLEKRYLKRTIGQEDISVDFKGIVFYFTSDIRALIDTSTFNRRKIDRANWKAFNKSNELIVDHLKFNIQYRLLEDLVNNTFGSYFLANFKCKAFDKLVFCVDPKEDDLYRVLQLTTKSKTVKSYKILSGYSPENHLLSLKKNSNSIDVLNMRQNGRL